MNIQTYQVKEESDRCQTGNNSQSKSAVGLLNTQARMKRDGTQVASCEDLKHPLEPAAAVTAPSQAKQIKSSDKLVSLTKDINDTGNL